MSTAWTVGISSTLAVVFWTEFGIFTNGVKRPNPSKKKAHEKKKTLQKKS